VEAKNKTKQNKTKQKNKRCCGVNALQATSPRTFIECNQAISKRGRQMEGLQRMSPKKFPPNDPTVSGGVFGGWLSSFFRGNKTTTGQRESRQSIAESSNSFVLHLQHGIPPRAVQPACSSACFPSLLPCTRPTRFSPSFLCCPCSPKKPPHVCTPHSGMVCNQPSSVGCSGMGAPP